MLVDDSKLWVYSKCSCSACVLDVMVKRVNNLFKIMHYHTHLYMYIYIICVYIKWFSNKLLYIHVYMYFVGCSCLGEELVSYWRLPISTESVAL